MTWTEFFFLIMINERLSNCQQQMTSVNILSEKEIFVYSMSNYRLVFYKYIHAYHLPRQGQGKKKNGLVEKWQRQSSEIVLVILII